MMSPIKSFAVSNSINAIGLRPCGALLQRLQACGNLVAAILQGLRRGGGLQHRPILQDKASIDTVFQPAHSNL
jgi:hypothetical protein